MEQPIINIDKILAWKIKKSPIITLIGNKDTIDYNFENIYLIKFQNQSYHHIKWLSEQELLFSKYASSIKTKLSRFHYTHISPSNENIEDSEFYNTDYLYIDRILEISHDNNNNNQLYLIKWNSLTYSEATWESFRSLQSGKNYKYIQSMLQDKISEFHVFNKIPNIDTILRIHPVPQQYSQIIPDKQYKNNNMLQSYQEEGVNWLLYNWYHRRSSLLADEMGLGKTVQVIIFLNYIIQNYQKGPFLIIAPLTTLTHWKREFEAWTNINVVTYQGTKIDKQLIQLYEFRYRSNDRDTHYKNKTVEGIYKFTVLITSYESVITDFQVLKTINWKVCTIDEAHRIKNKDSKLYALVRQLSTEHRILLTGTPIQNNVEELWSLLSFIEPISFRSLSEFMREYGNINDSIQVSKLQELLRPYLLRRLKEDVARNIPPKQETVVEVELTSLQKIFYKAIYERNREFLYKGLKSSNLPKLLNIVMELRKVCSHPFLIPGSEDRALAELGPNVNINDPAVRHTTMINASGKLVLLDKLLPRLLESKHQVLIFSQLKIILNLLETYLNYMQYKYERIDGDVRSSERQAAIDRFCAPNSDKFIFLLCTRAGGLGINLTSADTVIIFDSDWNPQNDIQAQARCHRIGQTERVQVYRLITRNTYETLLFSRASMKLGLDEAVLSNMHSHSSLSKSSNGDKTSSIEKKDIDALLKHGAYNLFNTEDSESKKFYEQNIDQILASRSTVITHKSDNSIDAPSTFSRATFASASSDMQISIEDPDFWEKVLPEDTHSALGLMNRLSAGEPFQSSDAKASFIQDLSQHTEIIIEKRKEGIAPDNLIPIQNILQSILVMNQFSNADKEIARQLYNDIEHPSRRKRMSSVAEIIDEEEEPTIELNAMNGQAFTKVERKRLEEAILAIVSSLDHSNIWFKIQKISKTEYRPIAEIMGFTIAFIEFCLSLVDSQQQEIFLKYKAELLDYIPNDIIDNPEYYSVDISSLSSVPKKKYSLSTPFVDPRTCTPTSFGVFNDPIYVRSTQRKVFRWLRWLKITELLEKEEDYYDKPLYTYVDELQEIQLPSKSLYKLKYFWNNTLDRALIVGASLHGCTYKSFEIMREDPRLPFKTIFTSSNNHVSDDDERDEKFGNEDSEDLFQNIPDSSFTNEKLESSFDNTESSRVPDNIPSISDNIPSISDNVNNVNSFPSNDISNQNEVQYIESISCFCGRSDDLGDMIQCDHCKKWFHLFCAGFDSLSLVPEHWYCKFCRNWPMLRILEVRLRTLLENLIKSRKIVSKSKTKTELKSIRREQKKAERMNIWTKKEKKDLSIALGMYGLGKWELIQKTAKLNFKSLAQIKDFSQKLFQQATSTISRFEEEYFNREKVFSDLEEKRKVIETLPFNNTLRDQTFAIIEHLIKLDEAFPFVHDVDPNEYPLYYNVIKNPMNLNKILNKIKNNFYLTISEINADVELMWDNCYLFNRKGSYMGKLAKKLSAKYQQLFEKIFLDSETNGSSNDVSEIVDSDLTPGLSKRLVERCELVSTVSSIFSHSDQELSIYFKSLSKYLIPIYTNSSTHARFPFWWNPEFHDKALLLFIFKYGYKELHELFIKDDDLMSLMKLGTVDISERAIISFISDFINEKPPFFERLFMVSCIIHICIQNSGNSEDYIIELIDNCIRSYYQKENMKKLLKKKPKKRNRSSIISKKSKKQKPGSRSSKTVVKQDNSSTNSLLNNTIGITEPTELENSDNENNNDENDDYSTDISSDNDNEFNNDD